METLKKSFQINLHRIGFYNWINISADTWGGMTLTYKFFNLVVI